MALTVRPGYIALHDPGRGKFVARRYRGSDPMFRGRVEVLDDDAGVVSYPDISQFQSIAKRVGIPKSAVDQAFPGVRANPPPAPGQKRIANWKHMRYGHFAADGTVASGIRKGQLVLFRRATADTPADVKWFGIAQELPGPLQQSFKGSIELYGKRLRFTGTHAIRMQSGNVPLDVAFRSAMKKGISPEALGSAFGHLFDKASNRLFSKAIAAMREEQRRPKPAAPVPAVLLLSPGSDSDEDD